MNWWHAFCAAGETEFGDAHVTMVLGPTPVHPEQLMAENGSMLTTSTGYKLTYARSWDHEPTDTEKDALIPDEYGGDE